jgi:hypothetical protein
MEMAEVRALHPHLLDMTLIAQEVQHDTDKMEKTLGHGPSAERMHNARVHEDAGKTMAELHVDFMDMETRFELCPFWGGGTSKRVDKTKPLLEECGQGESAFHQFDDRKISGTSKESRDLPTVRRDAGRCSRARAHFQARHYLFAFPSSQQGRSIYQSARNHRVSGVCRVGPPDPGTP